MNYFFLNKFFDKYMLASRWPLSGGQNGIGRRWNTVREINWKAVIFPIKYYPNKMIVSRACAFHLTNCNTNNIFCICFVLRLVKIKTHASTINVLARQNICNSRNNFIVGLEFFRFWIWWFQFSKGYDDKILKWAYKEKFLSVKYFSRSWIYLH